MSSPLALDQKELTKLNNNLKLTNVSMEVSGLQYIQAETELSIRFKIYEDGLIILERDFDEDFTKLHTGIKSLTDYYEKRLSPGIGYIFSLGASVPKELANIKTVYPYFVVAKNAKQNEKIQYLINLSRSNTLKLSTPTTKFIAGINCT